MRFIDTFRIMKRSPSHSHRLLQPIQMLLFSGMCLLLPGVFCQAHGSTVIADYTFAGSSGASSATDSSVVAGDFTINPSWATTSSTTYNLSTPTFGSNAPVWQIGTADTGNYLTESSIVAKGAYFSFTITPTSGTTLTISTLTFDSGAHVSSGGTVNIHYFLRSSLDNYVTTLASIGSDTAGVPVSTTLTSLTTETMDLTPINALNGLSAPITFRLYVGDDRGNNAAVTFLDNVTLYADAVPEPTLLSLSVVGFATMIFTLGRQHRKQVGY